MYIVRGNPWGIRFQYHSHCKNVKCQVVFLLLEVYTRTNGNNNNVFAQLFSCSSSTHSLTHPIQFAFFHSLISMKWLVTFVVYRLFTVMFTPGEIAKPTAAPDTRIVIIIHSLAAATTQINRKSWTVFTHNFPRAFTILWSDFQSIPVQTRSFSRSRWVEEEAICFPWLQQEQQE